MALNKTYRVSAKAIVIRKDKVLLLRKQNAVWDLPGGKLKKGETVERGLFRETREETGLRTAVRHFAGSYVRQRRGSADLFTIAFVCGVIGPAKRVKLSAEHVDAEWFNAREIKRLKMLEGCRRTVLKTLAELG